MVLEVADWSNLPSHPSSCSTQGSLWEEGFKEPRPRWKLGRSALSLQRLTWMCSQGAVFSLWASPLLWPRHLQPWPEEGKGRARTGQAAHCPLLLSQPPSKFSSRGLLLPGALCPPNNPQSISLPTLGLGGCPTPVRVQGRVGWGTEKSGLVGGIPAGG